jgi:hypothetical protein
MGGTARMRRKAIASPWSAKSGWVLPVYTGGALSIATNRPDDTFLTTRVGCYRSDHLPGRRSAGLLIGWWGGPVTLPACLFSLQPRDGPSDSPRRECRRGAGQNGPVVALAPDDRTGVRPIPVPGPYEFPRLTRPVPWDSGLWLAQANNAFGGRRCRLDLHQAGTSTDESHCQRAGRLQGNGNPSGQADTRAANWTASSCHYHPFFLLC